MTKFTINPSVATEIDISPISYNEKVTIFFTSDENWTGNYDFRLWNSFQKNIELPIDSALSIDGKVMKLIIEPIVQNLPSAKYYFELSSTSTKRLLFLGKISIIK